MNKANGIYGALIGDVVGSRFEWEDKKEIDPNCELFTKECRYTDDSLLTIATMEALLENAIQNNDTNKLETIYRTFAKRHLDIGFGRMFIHWVKNPSQKAYGSLGNGAAMRVSPIAYVAKSLEECLRFAEISIAVTHNSIEGISSAKAIAGATYLALHEANKNEIKEFALRYYPRLDDVTDCFDYLATSTTQIALNAFLNSSDFESSLRIAILNGGDTDTIAAMASSIARQINADNKSIDKNSTLIHSNVDNFIQRILDSFLFELLEEDACRSKESRKNAIERYGKYYCEDLGLLRTVSTSSELDAAAFENLVFLHLLHKQYKLRSLKFDFYDEIDHCVCKNRGIDFCFEKNNVPCFIQVTLALNSTNYNRETRNLLFSPKEGRRILVFSFDSTLSHPFGEKIEFMDISTFLANF